MNAQVYLKNKSRQIYLDRVQDETLSPQDRAGALFDLLNAIDEPLLGEILMKLEGANREKYDALLDFSTELSTLLDKAETTWGTHGP
jgi:hypothetical protein